MSNEADVRDILIKGVTLPAQCAGFTRAKMTNNEYDKPGLGCTVAYHGGELGESTVYIYNKGMPDIPDGPTSHFVRQELDQATREVVLMRQYAMNGQVALVDRYGTGSPYRGPEFLCAEFILSDASGRRRTFVYVTGANGHFVKVRITLQTTDTTDPTALNFVDAFASKLWCR